MSEKEIVAVILAGGKGSRLEALTKKQAKPAVHFGGKYRIIDFPLSNCANSQINTVAVLTQYESITLNRYIGIGSNWGFNNSKSGMTVLPPRETEEGRNWYRGTADAIYQNRDFIDESDPEYLLVLSGDHIYKMNYSKVLEYHKQNNADATITVIEVPTDEASRFGIMNTDEFGNIIDFEEKPKEPKSNLASMGIYIFNWKVLKKALEEDILDVTSTRDFGKDIIPKLLREEKKLVAYKFQGYWKDVGTIQSLWEANMDLLDEECPFDLYERNWRIYSDNIEREPHYIGDEAVIINSMVTQGCRIHGTVDNSVIFPGVKIAKGAYVKDSVLMPNVVVKEGAYINKAIVDSDYIIDEYRIVNRFGDEIELLSLNSSYAEVNSKNDYICPKEIAVEEEVYE